MKKNHGDKVLFAMILILMCFGLVMITSIGVPKSIQLSAPNILYPNCSDPKVDCEQFAERRGNQVVVGETVSRVAGIIDRQAAVHTAGLEPSLIGVNVVIVQRDFEEQQLPVRFKRGRVGVRGVRASGQEGFDIEAEFRCRAGIGRQVEAVDRGEAEAKVIGPTQLQSEAAVHIQSEARQIDVQRNIDTTPE